MARAFFSSLLTRVTVTLVLLAAGAMPASAQPKLPAMPSPAPKPKKYPDVPETVINQLLEGHLCVSEGFKALERTSRKHSDLPPAHVIIYQILKQRNQPDAARAQLEEAIESNSRDPEPYVILGNIALDERRIAEATMDFDKAKQLLATYTNAERKGAVEWQTMNGIARLAESRENWKEAEARLQDLLKLSPGDLLVHRRLAFALFWQGKSGDSYDILKKAKEIDRTNAKKLNRKESFLAPEATLAQYYEQFEGPTSTNPEKWFKAALVKAPDDLLTRCAAADWAFKRGKLPFAKEQAENILRIEWGGGHHDLSLGRMLCGLAALWEKDWPTAELNFQKVVLEEPNDLIARNNLALALVEQNDPAKKRRALAHAEANYRDKNSGPDALWTLGWVYFRRGDFDLAGLALEQAIRANGGKMDADTATYWAHVLHHRQQNWEAKIVLEGIVKSDRAFAMRPEAQQLYEKVKDAKMSESTPAAKPL